MKNTLCTLLFRHILLGWFALVFSLPLKPPAFDQTDGGKDSRDGGDEGRGMIGINPETHGKEGAVNRQAAQKHAD